MPNPSEQARTGLNGRRPHCSNCGSVGVVEFCPSCGQKRAELRLPLSEFIADGLSTLLSFDNRLFRTLIPLLTKPGLVTVETLNGHRARYVPPLRMYLITSFVFFICLQLFGGVITFTENDGQLTGSSGGGIVNFNTTTNAAADDDDDAGTAESSDEAADPSGTDAATEASESDAAKSNPASAAVAETDPAAAEEVSLLEGIFEDIAANPEQAGAAMLSRLPWMIFLLVPVAAVWLRLLLRKRERYYVPHLVASTHLHTAILSFLTLSQLTEFLPGPDVVGAALALYLPVYVARSLRRIYGLSWFSTLWRLALISFAHLLALLAALFGSVVLAGLSLG